MCKYTTDNDSGNLSDASDGEATEAASRPAKRSCVPAVSVGSGIGDGLPAPVRSGDVSGALPLLEELLGRMDRLEKYLMGRSPAETTDAGVGGSWRRGIDVSARTVRGLSIKHGGTRTRLWGPSSPRVLLNLVCAGLSGDCG